MRKKNLYKILFLIGASVFATSFWFINRKTSSENQKAIYTNLDKEFILHKNQTAIIKEKDLKITITDFTNSPCPKDTNCIWSGQAITLKYNHKRKTKEGINLNQAFGYKTQIIDTDYKTFAKIKVIQIK